MMLKKLGNYKIFLFSNSVLAFAIGLFMPFYMIFLQNFSGSIEQFGFSIGLMSLAYSITSYFIGKKSDKSGRKVFLIISGFILSAVVFAYSLINSLIQLYVLQIIDGIISSMYTTMEMTFLADSTKKSSRGLSIGKYRAITGIIGAISLMIGGIVAGKFGFEIIFYITSIIMFISTIFLFFIKEKKK